MAGDQAAPASAAAPPAGPTYEGKSLDDWLDVLERERALPEVEATLHAIDSLPDGANLQRLRSPFVKPAAFLLAKAFRLALPKHSNTANEVRMTVRSEVFVSTALLLASLAVQPDLRSVMGDQVLHAIAEQLAPQFEKTPPVTADAVGTVLRSPFGPESGSGMLPLYWISSGIVEQMQRK